jgi:formate dehydrogenase subunit delta
MTSDDCEPPTVRMLNDIAAQFAHRAPEVAAAAVAGHVRRFWEPRMRTQLLAATLDGAVMLEPVAAAAVTLLRADASS